MKDLKSKYKMIIMVLYMLIIVVHIKIKRNVIMRMNENLVRFDFAFNAIERSKGGKLNKLVR